jgi:hypothetical protein
MKLALLRFDDMVTVPGGKVLGSDMVGDACESTFRAADGWDLDEVTEGVFTLRAAHMPAAFIVGGYGYSYFAAPVEVVDTEAPAPVQVTKGKKR